MLKKIMCLPVVMVLMMACSISVDTGGNSSGTGNNSSGGNTTVINTPSVAGDELGRVTRVVDGDTIDVDINGEVFRVRYVGVNTPERDEVCYGEATNANRQLVENQTVRLIRDSSNTDRYGRLLRFVYVGTTFVNQTLVEQGYAEAVLYQPDDGFHDDFVQLERVAIREGRGCHPSGIFDDNSTTR